jgi:hypothetical protein
MAPAFYCKKLALGHEASVRNKTKRCDDGALASRTCFLTIAQGFVYYHVRVVSAEDCETAHERRSISMLQV